jgi:uncharacterized damage-inducible protein DinB
MSQTVSQRGGGRAGKYHRLLRMQLDVRDITQKMESGLTFEASPPQYLRWVTPMTPTDQPEPWLRGTLTDLPAVHRAVIHALELARVDIGKWCSDLSDAELNARVSGIAPVAFHLKHIGGSMDRLLTYAEGSRLTPEQIAFLNSELDAANTGKEIFSGLSEAFEQSIERIRSMVALNLEEVRTVGSKQLPSSVGGLLIHVAEHTLRHVGQAITTAKAIMAVRGG